MQRTPIHEVSIRSARQAFVEAIRDTGTPVPPPAATRRLTEADVAAVAEAVATALRSAVKEASQTPAPAPRRPDDSVDRGGGDAFRDRGDVLLGDFGRVAPRSYSLSDLADDENAMRYVFGGQPRG